MDVIFTDGQDGRGGSVRHGLHKFGVEGNSEKLAQYYSEKAEAYDEYSESTGRITGALELAKAVQDVNPNKNARILDVGAGTGLLGKTLRELGYEDIDALDFAQGMLNLAKSKVTYKKYICERIQADEKTSVADDTYDVLCMNGLIVPGHVTLDAFPELIRMTSCGGIIVFNVTEYALKTYPDLREDIIEAKLQGFVDDGSFKNWGKQVRPYYSVSRETCNIYIATLT